MVALIFKCTTFRTFSFCSHIPILRHSSMTHPSCAPVLQPLLLTCEARRADAKESSREVKAAGSGAWATTAHLPLLGLQSSRHETGNQGPSWKSALIPTVASSSFLPPATWGHLHGRIQVIPIPPAQGELWYSLMSLLTINKVKPGGVGSKW